MLGRASRFSQDGGSKFQLRVWFSLTIMLGLVVGLGLRRKVCGSGYR